MKIENIVKTIGKSYAIEKELYEHFNVKRGLRNRDGSGVLVGLTRIGSVHGYIKDEQEVVPVEGKLFYRGIDVEDLVEDIKNEERMGFEETIYLLLYGTLPNKKELKEFNNFLDNFRSLPYGFTENMVLKSPSGNIMNKLARSVLALYSYDDNPDDLSLFSTLRQCIELIARFPILISYGFQAKSHYFDNGSLFLHNPKKGLGTAQNFLRLIRPDKKFTELEAKTLDISLIIHAEHGGGNNSAFTTHVVTSSNTDTYSAIAAAVGSLKGPRHGGASIRVINMIDEIKENVKNWEDEKEIREYLLKILNRSF